jgi:MFS family permease
MGGEPSAVTTSQPEKPIPAAAWWMLALGVAAQVAGTVLLSSPAYLIPLLHLDRGLPLSSAGLLAAAPTIGTVVTLVLWGALADRYGERWVIAGGLALAAAFGFAAASVHGYLLIGVMLFFAGGCAASTNAASGRVVVGWFPRSRRGLAMGIRQMAQPLGVAIAAVAVPALARSAGIGAALLLGAVLAAVCAVACAAWIVNPPRPSAGSADARGRGPALVNPYRGNRFLVRIHTLSLLLVLPQFTLSVFGLVWLIGPLGWNATAAGVVVAASQIIGACGRIVVGQLSDRVGSRVRVLRWVAVSGVASMAAMSAVGALQISVLGAVVLIVAATVSVADNGLSFTSVAEAAGHSWAGKALGIQNTGQFIAASAVGPGIGALIGVVGYPLAFALVALAPLAAFPLVPAADQHRQ